MNKNWLQSKPNCYIEFRVYDKERFDIFQRFFDSLRQWTQAHSASVKSGETIGTRSRLMGAEDTQEMARLSPKEETLQRRRFGRPEEWMLAFKPEDLAYLGMPSHARAIRALREWHGMSRRERRKFIDGDSELQTLADFADMIRYWQDVEYELVSCQMEESDRARIEYSTYSFPFKGKVALEELLLFFGFFSVLNDSC